MTGPTKPPWQEFLDPQERPNREDLAAQHDVIADSLLEPVPMPRRLRGRRRPSRDKLSRSARGRAIRRGFHAGPRPMTRVDAPQAAATEPAGRFPG